MIYLITVPFNETPFVTEMPSEWKSDYHAFERMMKERRETNIACFFLDSAHELLFFLTSCNDLYLAAETKQEIKKVLSNFIVSRIEQNSNIAVLTEKQK